MSNFINTIDELGDKVTLKALVSHNSIDFKDNFLTSLCKSAFHYNFRLNSVDLPNVTTIGSYSFQYCRSIKSVNLPKLTVIASNSLEGCQELHGANIPSTTQIKSYNFKNTPIELVECPNVTTIVSRIGTEISVSGFDFTKKLTIVANAFSPAYNLSTLILRSSELCTLSNISAFNSTPIAAGYGWIYVPDDLVNTYKSASNWSTYAARIVPLSQYPKEFDGGTITDTWAQIFAAEEDGTYKTKYSLGDTKVVNINGACVIMQIVAFDEDDLADNTGKAKITWLSRGCIHNKCFNLTHTTEGGWEQSELREYMNNYILPKIDSVVRSNIKKVGKYSFYQPTNLDIYTEDFVWIPSIREIFGQFSGASESVGADYTDFFDSNSDRIKGKGILGNGPDNPWFLRTSYTGEIQRLVFTNGGMSQGDPDNNEDGIVLGFCT